ncbi:MAG: anthranilate phosphoribosyltransferase [Candidatus Omnitrophica bacterium]|jgi:anthranilate phosphoribosyltransferase|nr:anthranilate phosphoribosyltransferase [Candidatus Omnitrophota bacterium]
MIKEAAKKINAKSDLTADEMSGVMNEIMSGTAETADMVLFLTGLSEKGETIEEITAAASVMRAHSIRIKPESAIVLDTCGTGGDRKNTFNISTAAAFVVAGCGVTIAKHGNRSVSSICGSADILEALGISISLDKDKIERCLNQIGIAFLYAPDFHPALKHASAARKQIGRRTIFNILGPLCNPAGATHQLVGVYSQEIGPALAAVAGNIGIKHCLAVHGEGVMDEVTTTGWTEINEFFNGQVKTYRILPEEFGFTRAVAADIVGAGPMENAAIMLELLKGKPGNKRDIVVFNAAAALYAADKVASIKDGISLACEAIDSGKALEKLTLLKEYGNGKN